MINAFQPNAEDTACGALVDARSVMMITISATNTPTSHAWQKHPSHDFAVNFLKIKLSPCFIVAHGGTKHSHVVVFLTGTLQKKNRHFALSSCCVQASCRDILSTTKLRLIRTLHFYLPYSNSRRLNSFHSSRTCLPFSILFLRSFTQTLALFWVHSHHLRHTGVEAYCFANFQ